MTEDEALTLLKRRELSPDEIGTLQRDSICRKSRKVLNAMVQHPRIPRHVSLPLARHLFIFELMEVALTPTTPADLKLAVEDMIVAKLETISEGERTTLAKRGSTRVAAALLLDSQKRIVEAALNNPRLNEAALEKALAKSKTATLLPELISRHEKWSLRRDIRFALLKHPGTPLARVLEYANETSNMRLRDALTHSKLSANVREYLEQLLQRRKDPG